MKKIALALRTTNRNSHVDTWKLSKRDCGIKLFK